MVKIKYEKKINLYDYQKSKGRVEDKENNLEKNVRLASNIIIRCNSWGGIVENNGKTFIYSLEEYTTFQKLQKEKMKTINDYDFPLFI